MVRFRALSIAIVGALVLTACGQSGTSRSRATPRARTASPARTCTTSNLAVWLGLGEGGGTAGSTYYPLELTNVSGHTCRLFGFPGVSASDARQLGSSAQRDRSVPARPVTLARGATAHVLLRITDVSNLPASQCRPATATGLKVYPPDQRASRFVPFSFRACAKSGPVFLSVRPVEPGVGVPGYSAL